MMRSLAAAVAIAIISPMVLCAQLPPGFEVISVATGDDLFSSPRINNCGEAVYSFRWAFPNSHHVFRYDNGMLHQVTNTGLADIRPDINDGGTMVWFANFGSISNSAGDLVRFQDGVLTNIGIGTAASINNQGHVAWNWFDAQTCASESTIFFFDGSTVTQVTNNGLSNQSVDLNDFDDLAFSEKIQCDVPSFYGTIMFWSDGDVEPLPSRQEQSSGPTINNLGQVAWEGEVGIERWEDGATTLFTDWGDNPRLNNKGDMHFLRFHEGIASWQGWLWMDGEFYQLTNQPYPVWNTDGDINDWGEVVWRWRNLDVDVRGVKYMRRIRTGEADFDGHIDLKDAAAFQNCYTGEGDFDGTVGGFDRLCDCRFLDLDHDRDVDAADYALFATAMTGPQ